MAMLTCLGGDLEASQLRLMLLVLVKKDGEVQYNANGDGREVGPT